MYSGLGVGSNPSTKNLIRSQACKRFLFIVVFQSISNRWLSLCLHFQHMNNCFIKNGRLSAFRDSNFDMCCHIFKKKNTTDLQNFQISVSGFPVFQVCGCFKKIMVQAKNKLKYLIGKLLYRETYLCSYWDYFQDSWWSK